MTQSGCLMRLTSRLTFSCHFNCIDSTFNACHARYCSHPCKWITIAANWFHFWCTSHFTSFDSPKTKQSKINEWIKLNECGHKFCKRDATVACRALNNNNKINYIFGFVFSCWLFFVNSCFAFNPTCTITTRPSQTLKVKNTSALVLLMLTACATWFSAQNKLK